MEYFGKRGMSVMGSMLVQRVTKEIKGVPTVGLSYNFYDVVIDKYSSQTNVQVLCIINAVIDKIAQDYPEIKELMLGSDNASCLASHDNIPYIQHRNLNTRLGILIRNWIYTEACTGKDMLDTHFAYLALLLKRYILNGNDISTESDIYKAMADGTGLAGTTAVLLDGSKIRGDVFSKPDGKKNDFKASKTGARETHEML